MYGVGNYGMECMGRNGNENPGGRWPSGFFCRCAGRVICRLARNRIIMWLSSYGLLSYAGLGYGVDGDFVGFAKGIHKFFFNFCGVGGGGVDHD